MSFRPRLVISAIGLVILALALVGWLVMSGDRRIRVTSDAAFAASVASVRAGLPVAERAGFDDAVATVLASQEEASDDGAAVAVRVSGGSRMRLAGMTARDVMALAIDLRAKARARAVALAKRLTGRIAALPNEIAPLARLRDEDAAAARELAKITVSNTALTQRFWNQQIGRIISLHLTIRNGSDRAVSRLVMTGTITSEGRASPWLVADVPWEFKGGLQPGKEETLHLNPGSFNGEPRLDVTPDMRLGVQAIEVTGPDGVRIARPPFSDDERKRLAALEEELVEARKRLTEVESALRMR